MSPTRRAAAFVCGRRTKWLVVAFWIIVFGAAGPLAARLTDAQENDAAAWLPGSAESTRVVEIQQEEFRAGENLPAVMVYERSGGLTEADRAKVAADTEQIRGVDRMALGDVRDDLETIARGSANGLSSHVTGPAGVSADFASAFEGIDSTLLYAAMTVVILILLLSYRSPTLWMLPVLSAFTALTAAQAAVYLLAKYADLTVNAQTAGILLVLVFGASTDYALLLVARFRDCVGTTTGTRPWPTRSTAPGRPSWQAPRPLRSACCACSPRR